MLMRSQNKTKQQGFTLLEALISVAILSFGMLAIGSFQAKLVSESAYNKARAEAIALAQAKLDDLRSYSTEHEMVEKLLDTTRTNPDPTLNCQAANAEFCYPVDVPTTSTSYNDSLTGNNATFTREWSISREVTSDATDDDSVMSNIVVSVSWTDRKGEQQSVSLESDVTFRNPRGSADVQEVTEPVVQSPTGNAYLGDGSIEAGSAEGQMGYIKDHADEYGYQDNNDGTAQADADLDGDLELIVEKADGSAEVVLTLPKACKLYDEFGNPDCSGFVKISGTVFVNENDSGASYNLSITNLKPDDVWVIASDAAYCSRWVPTNDPNGAGTLSTSNDLTSPAVSGGRMYLDNDTTPDFSGAGYDNYSYFNYTCYLGGGWYGNIGLILLGENSQDYVCVGDPSADTANPSDKWRRVEVAKRRVYRGMLHKYDAADHSEIQVGGETLFYSQGIRDEAVYPNSNWAVRNYGHDYVIGKSNTQDVDNCKLLMGLPDANPDAATEVATGVTTPDLFYHRTGDFVCLNEDYENAPSGDYADFLGYPWHFLSDFDTTIYDARVDCPYDPSVPPSTKYTFQGTLSMESLHDSWGSTEPASGLFDGNINTSDGYANCLINSVTSSAVDYTCEYYVWSDINGNEYPWSGAAFVSTPSDVVCVPDTIASPVTSDYTHEAVYTITDINDNLHTNIDFTCKDMVDYSIQGTLTASVGNDLGTAGLAVTAYDIDGVEISDACSFNSLAADGSSVNYSCDNLLEASYLAGFSGDVKLSWSNTDFTCDGITSTDALSTSCTDATEFVPGEALWHFVDYIDSTAPAESTGNDLALLGPYVEYVVNGTVTNGTSPAQDIKTGMSVTTDSGVTCSLSLAANGKDVLYSCTLQHDITGASGTTWIGDLSINAAPGFYCATSGGSHTIPLAITSDTTVATAVTCEVDTSDYVSVMGSVFVYAPYLSTWEYVDVGAGNGSYIYGPVTFYNYVGPGLGDYVYNTITFLYDYVGPGLGDYEQVTVDDYTFVGAGFGDFEWMAIKTDLVTLSADMTGGSCSFTSVPTESSGLQEWFNFKCQTDSVVVHNTTWSGSITITTNEPPWEQCQLDSYTNTYVDVAPGTFIDNAFRAIDYPGFCADYAGPPPWIWIPSGLPWTPTYP